MTPRFRSTPKLTNTEFPLAYWCKLPAPFWRFFGVLKRWVDVWRGIFSVCGCSAPSWLQCPWVWTSRDWLRRECGCREFVWRSFRRRCRWWPASRVRDGGFRWVPCLLFGMCIFFFVKRKISNVWCLWWQLYLQKVSHICVWRNVYNVI